MRLGPQAVRGVPIMLLFGALILLHTITPTTSMEISALVDDQAITAVTLDDDIMSPTDLPLDALIEKRELYPL